MVTLFIRQYFSKQSSIYVLNKLYQKMNPDAFDEQIIKEKLHNGECILVGNTRDISSVWCDLRLIADAKDPCKPFIGWAVCRFCQAAFRTHSKVDDKGKRKNHGLTSCSKHLESCQSRQKEMAEKMKENSSIDSNTATPQPFVSQFLVNKRKLTSVWLNKLKEAEAKFVVGGKVLTNYSNNFSLFRNAFIQKC